MVLKIETIGLGYIGLPTALMFADHGAEVVGVDLSPNMIEKLNNGQVHIEEPGLQAQMTRVHEAGTFTAQLTAEEADVFIVSVPTPNRNDAFKSCDVSYVQAAVKSLLPFLKKGNIVIIESTIAPRTTVDDVQPLIESTGLVVGQDVYLAHCPERVLPGNILHELVHNTRIIGGVTAECSNQAAAVYARFVQGDIIKTTAGEAELSKLMENTYRDTNIALANELVKIGNKLKIDAHEVITMANRHPRVNIHQPGPGVGGHCLAVDPYFVSAAAPAEALLIQTARAVNTSMPNYIVTKVLELMADAPTKKVTLLGLAYKGNIDDKRESPAVTIFEKLRDTHLEVTVIDEHVQLPIEEQFTMDEAFTDSSLVLVLTDHAEYKTLATEWINKMSRPLILDTKKIVETCPEGATLHTIGNMYRLLEGVKQ